MKKHFINLTNGIETLEKNPLTEYSFIRIQSTACEQKRWDFILQDLDYTFLMALTQGNICYVYDYSNKKDTPRALYQGIPWIEYVLNRIWFNLERPVYVKKMNVTNYFEEQYKLLTHPTKKKLKYFKKFLDTDHVHIHPIGGKTEHDGSYEYYSQILKGKQ